MPQTNSASTSSRSAPEEFGARELDEARWLIQRAVQEDVPQGDVTTEALFLGPTDGASVCGLPLRPAVLTAAYVPRQAGVLCGVPVIREVFRREAPSVQFTELLRDGESLEAGTPCVRVQGPLVDILRLERVSLNFLQRLSGIATETRRWVDRVTGTRARILDTRKTTPAWRYLEKYAVRTGGGSNHRASLSDAILLKDNHAEALRKLAAGTNLPEWVARLRESHRDLFLQVEVDDRHAYAEALESGVDAILLDNFSSADLRWAVEVRDARGSDAPLLEASGGIRLDRVREIAETGIDRISVGYLTHSPPSLDIGLDMEDVREAKQGGESS